MTKFAFDILLTRKDGSQEQAGILHLEHEDYDGHNDQTALAHLTANKAEYGFTVDHDLALIMCGGVAVPLAEFAKLEVRLQSKSRPSQRV